MRRRACTAAAPLPLLRVVARLLRLTVVATGLATAPELPAPPSLTRPHRGRGSTRAADDAPADDELTGAAGAALEDRPPDPLGLEAATSAAEGPPEPPRRGMAPPPPEGAAGCHGVDRPVVGGPARSGCRQGSACRTIPPSEWPAPWPGSCRLAPPPAAPRELGSGAMIPIGNELAGAGGALVIGVGVVVPAERVAPWRAARRYRRQPA